MSNTDIGLRLQVLESLKFMLDNTETDANTANMFGLSNGMEGVLDRVNDQFVKRFYERYADDVFGILRKQLYLLRFLQLQRYKERPKYPIHGIIRFSINNHA